MNFTASCGDQKWWWVHSTYLFFQWLWYACTCIHNDALGVFIYYLNGEYWTRTASFHYRCHSTLSLLANTCAQYKLTGFVNPFSVSLPCLPHYQCVSLLVLKQPLKVPSLKSLKPFLPFTWAHKRILSKWRCTVLNVVPSNIVLALCRHVRTF